MDPQTTKTFFGISRSALLTAAAGAFLSLFSYFLFSAPSAGAPLDRITFAANDSQVTMISELADQGYVRSKFVLEEILKWKGETVSPGAYVVSKSMGVFALAKILSAGAYEKWIVIPEGLRKEEVAQILAKDLALPPSEQAAFLSEAKEGYLFPDTYLISATSSGKDIADRMMSHFSEETADLFKEAATQNIRNDTMVILASLIQREAGSEAEMPLIASVIWNRLDAGMPLQMDASVQYAIATSAPWWKPLSSADLKIPSPYNTYLNAGKPAGPICSPGLVAMNAVVNPAKTDYLYYIHDASGQIHLAATYDEQLDNIAKYLKN